MNTADLTVVGGGVSGLAAAWHALGLQPGLKVVVLEAAARWGGKLVSHRQDGFLMEGAADSFLTRKPAVLDLVRSLGLADQLISPRPENRRSWIYSRGELRPLPPGFSGLVPSRPDLLKNTDSLDPDLREEILAEKNRPAAPACGEESLESFFVRRFGKRSFEEIFEPLLTGIYSGDSSRLSLQAAFPQLAAIEASGSSLLAHWEAHPPAQEDLPAFLSFREGMEALPRALVDQLVKKGAELRTGQALAGLSYDSFSRVWTLQTPSGKVRSRSVILALAPAVSARVLENLPGSGGLAKVLAQVSSASAAVFHLGFDVRDLPGLPAGSGFVGRRGEDPFFTACTFSSQKWEGRAPEGTTLVRFYTPGAPLVDQDAWEGGLCGFLARFNRQRPPRPLSRRLFVWKDALPQPNLGHLDHLAQIDDLQRRTPGLFLAGAYFQGVGLPDSIQRARRTAEGAVEFLGSRKLHDKRSVS